jgi:creatinine amidohydrolase
MDTIFLADLSWPQIAEIQKKPHLIILPVGSTEQHGHHLPIDVDSCLATYLAEQAAQKVNAGKKIWVLVAPTIHYTEVETFKEFPGTIGISLDTEVRLLQDVVRSVITNGFNNILVLNGHSSNTIPINTALRQVNSEFPDAGLYAVNWWALGNLPKILKSPPSLHAEEMETSLYLVADPDKVDLNKAGTEYPKLSLSEKWVTPDFYGLGKTVFYHSRKKYPKFGTSKGIMGDATTACKETGEKIAKAVVADLVEIIVEIVASEEKKS